MIKTPPPKRAPKPDLEPSKESTLTISCALIIKRSHAEALVKQVQQLKLTHPEVLQNTPLGELVALVIK